MTQNQQIATGIGVAFAGPLLIGLLFQLSGFTILIVVGVLLAAVVAFVLLWEQPQRPPIDPFPNERRQRTDEEDDEPRPVRKAPEPTTAPVSADLPSIKEGYTFQFTATMAWLAEPGVEHSDRSAVAAQAIFTRAGRITAKFALTERDEVLNRLRAALGASQRDGEGIVSVSAGDIEIETVADDVDRLRRMTNLAKQSEELDHQTNYDRHVRTYFGDEALKTPGSTLLSWLARNRFDFDEADRRLDTFARLSAVAQDKQPPPRQAAGPGLRFVGAPRPAGPRQYDAHPAVALIDELLPSASADERGLFADDLAHLLDEHGAAGAAGRLRGGYGLQDLKPAEPAERADHGGRPPSSPTIVTDDSPTTEQDLTPPTTPGP